jgi:hypothetical protein
MNILDIQDKLKGLSQDQLAQEMQSPTGAVPQFLVLGEMNRRQSMRQAMQQQNVGKQTVAQELLSGAGIPAEGMTDMAQSMAPQSSIAQNTGISALPQEAPPPEQGGIAALAPEQATGMFAGGPVTKMAGGSGVVSSDKNLGPNSLYRLFGGIGNFLSSDVNVDPQGNISISNPNDVPEVSPVDPREANAMTATPTPITPPTKDPFGTEQPSTNGVTSGSGSGGGGGKMSSYEQMLADAMANADKKAKQDKWLALAQAGMALMSSNQSTIGGALGEAGTAGIAGLQSARDTADKTKLALAQEQYGIDERKAALARASAPQKPKPASPRDLMAQLNDVQEFIDKMDPPVEMGAEPKVLTDAELASLDQAKAIRDGLVQALNQSGIGAADLADPAQ